MGREARASSFEAQIRDCEVTSHVLGNIAGDWLVSSAEQVRGGCHTVYEFLGTDNRVKPNDLMGLLRKSSRTFTCDDRRLSREKK